MSVHRAMHLHYNIFDPKKLKMGPTREGFGLGLREAGQKDPRIVGLCADLVESTRMLYFAEKFPDRFFDVGVAEQNLVTVGSGMAAEGKIPFVSSYATFSPGRNWEQIRTTVCYNNQNVKVVGSHAGLSVGPDGATHQALEDISIMRSLPNMVVVVPADQEQARKATLALAKDTHPAYLRLAREKSPIFTTEKTPFQLRKAYVYMKGSDVTVIACGPVLYEALVAAHELARRLSVEVINVPTIKPLDEATILRSVRKTRCVVTVEEHQVIGGLGGAIAELLAQRFPTPMEFVGVQDRFGESGPALELWEHFGISPQHIVASIQKVLRRRSK